ncbi:MAG: DNA-3-methyladenine glycosylase [Acidobacteria bacterium]|nr:DNA-3-methyladenine glycosylase [Acidobacteriota bacterium]
MTVPYRSLRFEPEALGWAEFPRSFFHRDTADVARRLIGAWLARRHRGRWYGARIVETEAYLGSRDAAAHSRGGRRTPRVEPMYMNGGHLYVFLVYGMHHCTNVVTRETGVAEAVLIRAAEGPAGTPAGLLRGPAKLSRGLGITTESSGKDLLGSGDVRLFHNGTECGDIGTSTRIGVEYAGEAAGWPLRFFDTRSAEVSGPARLKRIEPKP